MLSLHLRQLQTTKLMLDYPSALQQQDLFSLVSQVSINHPNQIHFSFSASLLFSFNSRHFNFFSRYSLKHICPIFIEMAFSTHFVVVCICFWILYLLTLIGFFDFHCLLLSSFLCLVSSTIPDSLSYAFYHQVILILNLWKNLWILIEKITSFSKLVYR